MSFTSDEIRAAVDEFLNSPVEVPVLGTGTRDILLARDRAFDLLVHALVGDPRAVYHLAWLTSNRVYGLIREQCDFVSIMIRAAYEHQQVRFRPITQLDELITAQAALLDIDAAASAPGSGVTGPGIGRFQRVTTKFISRELAPMLSPVTDDGVTTIPDTPLNERRTIQHTWRDIKARDALIKSLISGLSSLLQDMNTLRLPERSVQSLIGRLRSRTESILEELSSKQAEESSRRAYLDLLVMNSILSRTSSFSAPKAVLAQGLDARFTAPSVGARAASTVSGPYAFDGGEVLEIVVGGVSEFVPMPSPALFDDDPPAAPRARALRAQEIADAINDGSSVTAEVEVVGSTIPLYILSAFGTDNTLFQPLFTGAVGYVDYVTDSLKVGEWVTEEAFNAATKVFIDDPLFSGEFDISSRIYETRTFYLSANFGVSSIVQNYIGIGPPVQGVQVGENVSITGGPNVKAGTKYYKVSEVTDRVTLDDDILRYKDWEGTTVRHFGESSVELFYEYLHLTSPPGSSMSIPDSTVSAALGLDSSGLSAPVGPGMSSSVRIPGDLVTLGGGAGDTILLDFVEHEVAGVTSTSTTSTVELTVPVEYSAAPMKYSYKSAKHLDLLAMIEGLADYPEDLVDRFDVLVSQITTGKSASRMYREFSEVKVILEGLQPVLMAYTSPGRSRGLDAAVAMMREHGMDRAVDMLLALRLNELFTMDRDGVSYSTHLARSAATATRVVSPASKHLIVDEEVLGVFDIDTRLSG